MRLALFEPDIPQNTGALLRLAACFGVEVDLIEPCGFLLDDRRLKRVITQPILWFVGMPRG
jgi:tRNA (cytidine/uridine-2'-O-)-methyltransferase